MTTPILISSFDCAFQRLGVCLSCLGGSGESGFSIWVDLEGWWHKRPLGGKYL